MVFPLSLKDYCRHDMVKWRDVKGAVDPDASVGQP